MPPEIHASMQKTNGKLLKGANEYSRYYSMITRGNILKPSAICKGVVVQWIRRWNMNHMVSSSNSPTALVWQGVNLHLLGKVEVTW